MYIPVEACSFVEDSNTDIQAVDRLVPDLSVLCSHSAVRAFHAKQCHDENYPFSGVKRVSVDRIRYPVMVVRTVCENSFSAGCPLLIRFGKAGCRESDGHFCRARLSKLYSLPHDATGHAIGRKEVRGAAQGDFL